jgi:hypothetical protein
MDYIVRIDFQLLGTSLSPKEITGLTGILPDTELKRGERDKARDLPRQSIWSKMSHVHSDDISAHWDDLGSFLSGYSEILKGVADTGKAKLTIVVKSHDRIPSIQIPPEMSRFAGSVGAVIDIDHIQS